MQAFDPFPYPRPHLYPIPTYLFLCDGLDSLEYFNKN